MQIAAAVTLAIWLAMIFIVLYSYRHVSRLEDIGAPRDGDPPLPRLSVIVAARNEERGVEQALRSLLDLDYPDYEVIFVDDRSDDRTGEIADRLSAAHDRLAVIHVKELPAGWFGKNHASWRARARRAGKCCSSLTGTWNSDPRPSRAGSATCSAGDWTTSPRCRRWRCRAPCWRPA